MNPTSQLSVLLEAEHINITKRIDLNQPDQVFTRLLLGKKSENPFCPDWGGYTSSVLLCLFCKRSGFHGTQQQHGPAQSNTLKVWRSTFRDSKSSKTSLSAEEMLGSTKHIYLSVLAKSRADLQVSTEHLRSGQTAPAPFELKDLLTGWFFTTPIPPLGFSLVCRGKGETTSSAMYYSESAFCLFISHPLQGHSSENKGAC